MKAPHRILFREWPPLTGLWLLLTLLVAPGVRAQVVDDTTKVLYGPKTTRIIYEAEVLRDSTSGIPIDTTLTRWPQARFWVHDTAFQQDLGAVGTASRPLLYQPNLQLGARFGRNAYDRYAREASTVPYYDSRSPYSFFRYIQSSAGEQVFEISYTRSLKKNFSVGVAYERIASNKINAPRSPRDGLVEHSNLLLFGRFQSENERYHLLINFSNVRHRAIEQGGIRPLGDENPLDLFGYRQELVHLAQAANYEDRDELYFTHTYRLLGRGLTAYHTFDLKRQYNSFADLNLALLSTDNVLEDAYFPRKLNSPTATLDRAQYTQLENTIGVLGRTANVEYRLYARDRSASLLTQTLFPFASATELLLTQAAPPRAFNQVFAGGTAAFNYRTVYAVETAGEIYFLPLSGLSAGSFSPEYWLRGTVRTGPLSGEVLLNSYAPTLTQQEFNGNHYAWSHWSGSYQNPVTNAPDGKLSNTSTQQLTGRLRLKLPDFGTFSQQRFEASASGVNIFNLVYYGPDGAPMQLSDTRNLLIGFARHRMKLGRVSFDNQATYTYLKGGPDVDGLRIPILVSDSRVYYESYIFRKAMFTQVGLELYYQSKYKAFDYSPSTQQFYQQDAFTIPRTPIADVFFVADIKTVSVFLKVAYFNQNLGANGYYATPYYSGYPRRFQFGVRWNFFD